MLDKISVAVIGATGAVGQRFIQLLENHPWFDLDLVSASDKSAGRKYKDTVSWSLAEGLPEEIGEKTVHNIDPKIFKSENIDLIFSALPADVAMDLETELATAGFSVFSNASSHRMDKHVPLLIADINPSHISLIKQQQRITPGFIVTNPNCTIAGLATGLKPISDSFGISEVIVTTYQALSGAGYPGVPSIDITGNILPFIPNEEEKVELECKKILGKLTDDGIIQQSFEVVANCARVPVRDGHLEAVVVELESDPSINEFKNVLKNFKGLADQKLPTAPKRPIIVTNQENRPQPVLDINSGSPTRASGMAITIGRIKKVNRKIRFFLIVHNTIRGAAGCSIMNAELAKVENYL